MLNGYSMGLRHTNIKGVFRSSTKQFRQCAFPTLLEAASLELYPQDSCLLFQKDQHGKTACEYAFDKYGKDTTIKVLRDLIPPNTPQFPILHHVAKHIPKYMNDFAIRYTASIHTRDDFGRTVPQVEIQRIIASEQKT